MDTKPLTLLNDGFVDDIVPAEVDTAAVSSSHAFTNDYKLSFSRDCSLGRELTARCR